MSRPEKIKSLRIKARRTQREVAIALGVTEAAYIRWERGTAEPGGQNLIKLVQYFREQLSNPKLDVTEIL